MRKIMMCLAVSLVMLTGGNAFAQEVVLEDDTPDDPTGLQIGVLGLLNYSTVAYSADVEKTAEQFSDAANYKLGFGGGLRLIAQFTPFLGIQPEILFKQYGVETELKAGSVMAGGTTTTSYLEVPLLLRVTIPVGGDAFIPKFLIGPTVGYYLFASKDEGDKSTAIKDQQVNKFDIGAAVGIGADIAAGPGSVSVDLRYDRSFTATNSETDTDDGLTGVNTGFSFLVGYNYKI